MFPKFTAARLLLSVGTAAAGYTSYKIQEGRQWISEKLETINGLLSIFGSFPKRKANGHLLDDKHYVDGCEEGVKPSARLNDADTDAGQEMQDTPDTYKMMHESQEFSGFVKRMIEIDGLLRNGTLQEGKHNPFDEQIALPKIVVVGSQSSGKSSVLETLVGHSFLPKGNNMVTRRPLLLTLVHEPNCASDYAVFPGPSGSVRLDEFDKVAERVKELNMAVPDGEWVTDVPIDLQIHSSRLPDLTLIDLPGYIAVSNKKQPAALRDRIRSLCDVYLRDQNIILAVSAADVDLANSESLQAARKYDPAGTRTIGVVTKLDLVSPELGSSLLSNDDYPLQLGYVGVVCGPNSRLLQDNKDYAVHYRNAESGIEALQRKLVNTLENSLRGCISSVLTKVNHELSEIRYELKAKYSDKSITAEGYLAEAVGRVREKIDELSNSFTKSAVKELLRKELFDKHLIDILIVNYEDCFKNNADDAFTRSDLHSLTMQLTRAGWGRKCAHVVADDIMRAVKREILETEPLLHHPSASSALMSSIDTTCRSRIIAAADQIENALRPFKQPDSVEFDSAKWRSCQQRLLQLLLEEKTFVEQQMKELAASAGGSDRVRRVVERVARSEMVTISEQALADQMIALWKRQSTIANIHSSVLGSKWCSKTSSTGQRYFWRNDNGQMVIKDACQLKCPSVYLYMVSQKLLQTASLYAQDELAPDQRLRLPDLLFEKHHDDPLGFVRENASVFYHISLLSRQSLLETVRERLLHYMDV